MMMVMMMMMMMMILVSTSGFLSLWISAPIGSLLVILRQGVSYPNLSPPIVSQWAIPHQPGTPGTFNISSSFSRTTSTSICLAVIVFAPPFHFSKSMATPSVFPSLMSISWKRICQKKHAKHRDRKKMSCQRLKTPWMSSNMLYQSKVKVWLSDLTFICYPKEKKNWELGRNSWPGGLGVNLGVCSVWTLRLQPKTQLFVSV